MLKIYKEKLITILTEELPVLRAKLGLSQEALSEIIDISRQTYSVIEKKKNNEMEGIFVFGVCLQSK